MRPSSVHIERDVTRARPVMNPPVLVRGLVLVGALPPSSPPSAPPSAPSSSPPSPLPRCSSPSNTSMSTTTMPSVAMRIRSSMARSSLVPLPFPPSLNIVCSLASPSKCMFPSVPCCCPLRSGVTPIICPLPMTVECRTPHSRANDSCSFKKAYSPCTGRKCSGCSIFKISSSSSRYACPDECRPSSRRIAISGPRIAMAFIMRITRFSFPGIILAE
mmetsp:Transcript_33911/g.85364  ORF Transcript_33911/g.85364 Transcript_33911/m.85364 type:complete len:217 (+) Transcript_33911:793-1443(+)